MLNKIIEYLDAEQRRENSNIEEMLIAKCVVES